MQGFKYDQGGGTAVLEELELPGSMSPPARGEFDLLTHPNEISDFGSITVADQQEVLYGSSPQDVQNSAEWLSLAPQNTVVRITGGCLLMNQERVQQVQNLVENALEGYKGILISGDTVSVNAENPMEVRPCMPEVGPRVAANNPFARHLGVFPGESLKVHNSYIEVGQDFVDGKIWEIRAHERPGRRMAVNERTDSFWQAEREQVFDHILPAIDKERPPEVIAIIGFDGGPETEAEYRQAAALSLEDPRYHLFLISGGGEERATDTLIRDEEFLRSHPNVHVISQDLLELRSALIAEGVIQLEY